MKSPSPNPINQFVPPYQRISVDNCLPRQPKPHTRAYNSNKMSFPDSRVLSTKEKLQVIIDCDAGADDAFAIFVLLAGEASKEIEIKAITCVQGNTSVENVCQNVLSTLQAADRLDIPVFCGAHNALIPHETASDNVQPFHGKNGFGDVDTLKRPDISLIQKENAIEALNRIVSKKIGQITLVCLGPLTNVALALKTYQDFGVNLKDIFVMGGNYKGIGNTTPCAEFNFHADPEAAHIVLSSVSCPITLLPWEASVKADIPLEWRFNKLGELDTPQIKLLNQVEAKIYKQSHATMWSATDAIVAAMILHPSIITHSNYCHLTVELHGHHTRGQAVVDHLVRNKPNVKIVKNVDCEKFREILYATCALRCFKE